MASIRYDQVPLTLQFGTGYVEKIIAFDCTLSQAADLQPVKAIGFNGCMEQTPQGARTASIAFSYTPSLTVRSENIVNELASGLKHLERPHKFNIKTGVSIVFGGVRGEGLLSSDSFSVRPYSPVECNVNFELFGSGANVGTAEQIPTSGRLQAQDVTRYTGQQFLAGANDEQHIGHSSFSSFMAGQSPATISTEGQTGILTSVDYSINFDYEPVYTLGNEFPSVFICHGATEEAKITENMHETGISFTGKSENFTISVNSLTESEIEVSLVGQTGAPNRGMLTKMENPVVADTQLSVSSNSLVETSKTLRSYY